MKRVVIIFLSLFFLLSEVAAQPISEQGVLIGLQGGVGYGLYRDLGASPLTYRGLELLPGIAVSVEKPMWRYKAQLGLSGGGYGLAVGFKYMQAYGGQVNVGFETMHKIAEYVPWQLWLGASVDDRADVRYNSVLGNSCVGSSNFFNLNLIGRTEVSVGNWMMHAQLALTPVSLLLRPGFAYMDNYDHEISNPLADYLKQYRWYISGATIAVTDLGATLRLKNGNRIGVSYRWHYMTSRATVGTAAPYVFEQAGHALLFHMGFKL